MATYSYTKLADYILDQLWGFASVNSVKNSLRYIAEDILGDPGSNSNMIPDLDMDNGATHGGRINFNGGTTSYIGSSADGLTLQMAGFTDASVPAGVANDIRDATTRATGGTPGQGGVAISTSNSGSFSTTSGSMVDVTNMTVTLTTTGRPVLLALISDVSASTAYISVEKNGATSTALIESKFMWQRGGADLALQYLRLEFPSDTSASHVIRHPPGALMYIDPVAAGTYTYKLQAAVVGFSTAGVQNCKMIAFEL